MHVCRYAASILTTLSIVGSACGSTPDARRRQPNTVLREMASRSADAVHGSTCTPPKDGLRLSRDVIAGLSTRASVAELRASCQAARLDTIGMGGDEAVGLRFDYSGGTVWAVQADDADSLVAAKPATWWAAAGDSLRFSSGELIPRTAGELRRFDSVGVVVLDRGDDTEGSFVVLCRHPELGIIYGWELQPILGRDTTKKSRFITLAPLRYVRTTDTLRYWRIDVGSTGYDDWVREFCRGAPGA
jgi:hypothetical protein